MTDLFDLTDEELEVQFRQAKEELASQEEMEEFSSEEDTPIDDSVNEDPEEGIVGDQEEVGTSEDDDGLEHPEEDSNHDLEQEDSEEASEEQDPKTLETDTPGNADTESKEKEASSEEASKEIPAKSAEKIKARADGQDFEFSPEEALEKFPKVFSQAMSFTKKMQTLKPWKRSIDAMEQANISHEDVNLMIDVLKGDKDAIAEVLKKNEINILDLDVDEAKYTPNDYGRDEEAIILDEVISEISGDSEFNVTQDVLTRQWDEQSVGVLAKQPELIRALHEDVQTGTFAQVAPIASKLKVYDGGKRSDLDYYKDAAIQYVKQQQQQKVLQQQPLQQLVEAPNERIEAAKQAEASRKATKTAAAKRKAAAPTRNKAGKPKAIDYLDDSDEAFDEWYREVMDR